MDGKTVTRADLAELFARQFFISQNKSAFLVEIVLEEIYEALSKRNQLKISSFGTFIVHQKNQRLGRNPKTGKEATISARKSLSFRPSVLLKEKVNRKAFFVKH